MNHCLLISLFTVLLSQVLCWERIEQIQEGYQYNTDSNSNGDIVVGGFELNSDYAMQIYFKQNNQDWIEIPGNGQITIMNGDILITDTQSIYVCDFAMGLYRTNNLGADWSSPSELTFDGCSAFNIHDNGTLFLGMTYSGIGFIHRSFDNGSSWEAISLPNYDSNYPVEHIEFDSEGNIYLGTINGIYKSADNGEDWQKMNNGINGEHVSSMFVDENDNIYIYTTYSSSPDGMYYSIDNAESWLSLPIPDYYVVDILVQNDIIMIIDGYNNIQVTEDLGNTWSVSDEGLNDNSLYSLHLRNDNMIYVGGRYIHKSNDGTDLEVSYQADWNLVGLPLDVEDASYSILFPESIEGTLYSFDNGYNLETSLIQGEGYWLRFNEEGSTTISGIPINEVTLSLNEEWNLISGISIPLAITEIQDPDGIIISGTIYGFISGGYLNAEILEPGKGYWIRANNSGYIFLISNPELLPEECYLEPDVGPCDGVCPGYFYNQETEECEEFSWGCCEGLVPFDTLEECINTCE